MFKRIILSVLVLLFVFTVSAYATVGVGINNGKIIINDKLKPGVIYNLPDVIVFNTGTEVTNYEVSIKYNEKQTQLKPDESWFKFSPQRFTLAAKQAQKVKATLQLSLGAKPGDYFAYIDAHPVVGTLKGITTIGIAAGSKIYFTVLPSNIFISTYFRIITLITENSPWSYLIITAIVIILAGLIVIKKVHINISVRKKE